MESILFFIFLAASIALIIYLTVNDKKKKAEFAAIMKKKQEDYISQLTTTVDKYQEDGIPVIQSLIPLKKGDKLHAFFDNVEWKEYRKVRTGTVAGHGLTARVKIAKGLYYRYGVGQMAAETMDQLKTIDKGSLYFTNKGLLFKGITGNKSITYDKIPAIIPYYQGFQIERDSGKNVYIPCDLTTNPKFAAAIVMAWENYRNSVGA